MKSNILILIRRTKNSIYNQGLKLTLFKLYLIAADRLFDIKYGIDTCKVSELSELTIHSINKERGGKYEATRFIPLRRMFNVIKHLVPADSILVDLGCGKGRVLLVASEFDFREVRGIEFAEDLCKIAKKNYKIYASKKGYNNKCQIINCDVTNYSIGMDENVFFMFNPFDEIILKKVLENMSTSLQIQNRKIWIIYRSAKHGHIIEQNNYFSKLQDYSFIGHDFTVYTNHF